MMTLVSSLRKNIFAVVGGSRSIHWASGLEAWAVPAQKACAWVLKKPRNPLSMTLSVVARMIGAEGGWLLPEKAVGCGGEVRGRCRQLLAHDLRARRDLGGIIASNERQ